MDDADVDGNQTFQVSFAVSSGDPGYDGLSLADLDVVNVDDDAPVIRVVGGPLHTDERGTADTFQVTLGSAPPATW
ncbi:MAG: hypothetical protein R3F59_04480 [Myxococcota bacterium]